MAIRVVRLVAPRARGEGVRLGTVRRPPRGVPKAAYATRNFYDVWLPELAPSQALLTWATSVPWTEQRWRTFEKRYRAEMAAPAAARMLALLAALSVDTSFSVGCYCEDGDRCHRAVLRELLREAGAVMR